LVKLGGPVGVGVEEGVLVEGTAVTVSVGDIVGALVETIGALLDETGVSVEAGNVAAIETCPSDVAVIEALSVLSQDAKITTVTAKIRENRSFFRFVFIFVVSG